MCKSTFYSLKIGPKRSPLTYTWVKKSLGQILCVTKAYLKEMADQRQDKTWQLGKIAGTLFCKQKRTM